MISTRLQCFTVGINYIHNNSPICGLWLDHSHQGHFIFLISSEGRWVYCLILSTTSCCQKIMSSMYGLATCRSLWPAAVRTVRTAAWLAWLLGCRITAGNSVPRAVPCRLSRQRIHKQGNVLAKHYLPNETLTIRFYSYIMSLCYPSCLA